MGFADNEKRPSHNAISNIRFIESGQPLATGGRSEVNQVMFSVDAGHEEDAVKAMRAIPGALLVDRTANMSTPFGGYLEEPNIHYMTFELHDPSNSFAFKDAVEAVAEQVEAMNHRTESDGHKPLFSDVKTAEDVYNTLAKETLLVGEPFKAAAIATVAMFERAELMSEKRAQDTVASLEVRSPNSKLKAAGDVLAPKFDLPDFK